MGLSGRKVKQRIGNDPRNLSWADNAAKFGQSYLSKFGWDASGGVGLGARGDGVVSHIKVAQKLNLLGIGAGSNGAGADPTVAWKQSREYEELLKRLNAGSEEQSVPDNGAGDKAVVEMNEGGEEVNEEKVDKKKRKRSKDDKADVEEEGDDAPAKKKEKKERDDEKVEKREKKSKDKKSKKKSSASIEDTTSASTPAQPSAAPSAVFAPRPMAHRARFLASKRLAVTSSSAISEILGIASSSSTPSSSTPLPESTSTSSTLATQPQTTQSTSRDPASTPIEPTELLTTSKKSVADYFKERLLAKSQSGAGKDEKVTERVDEEDGERSGIGMKSGIGQRQARDDDGMQGAGIGTGAPWGRIATIGGWSNRAPEVIGEDEETVDMTVGEVDVERKEAKKAKKLKKSKRRDVDAPTHHDDDPTEAELKATVPADPEADASGESKKKKDKKYRKDKKLKDAGGGKQREEKEVEQEPESKDTKKKKKKEKKATEG